MSEFSQSRSKGPEAAGERARRNFEIDKKMFAEHLPWYRARAAAHVKLENSFYSNPDFLVGMVNNPSSDRQDDPTLAPGHLASFDEAFSTPEYSDREHSFAAQLRGYGHDLVARHNHNATAVAFLDQAGARNQVVDPGEQLSVSEQRGRVYVEITLRNFYRETRFGLDARPGHLVLSFQNGSVRSLIEQKLAHNIAVPLVRSSGGVEYSKWRRLMPQDMDLKNNSFPAHNFVIIRNPIRSAEEAQEHLLQIEQDDRVDSMIIYAARHKQLNQETDNDRQKKARLISILRLQGEALSLTELPVVDQRQLFGLSSAAGHQGVSVADLLTRMKPIFERINMKDDSVRAELAFQLMLIPWRYVPAYIAALATDYSK